MTEAARTMETHIGNHVDSDDSTDDGEDDIVIQEVGRLLPRKCRWCCYQMSTALRILGIDPCTYFTMRIRDDVKIPFSLRPCGLSSSPVTVQQRNDVKVLFAGIAGPILHKVRLEDMYLTLVPNEDIDWG